MTTLHSPSGFEYYEDIDDFGDSMITSLSGSMFERISSPGRSPVLDTKDTLLTHWLKMVTLPTRRAMRDVTQIFSLRKNPRMLVFWAIPVYLDAIEANYYYFVKGETIEEW